MVVWECGLVNGLLAMDVARESEVGMGVEFVVVFVVLLVVYGCLLLLGRRRQGMRGRHRPDGSWRR